MYVMTVKHGHSTYTQTYTQPQTHKQGQYNTSPVPLHGCEVTRCWQNNTVLVQCVIKMVIPDNILILLEEGSCYLVIQGGPEKNKPKLVYIINRILSYNNDVICSNVKELYLKTKSTDKTLNFRNHFNRCSTILINTNSQTGEHIAKETSEMRVS